ncbi:MAG: tetratricopeptide repeat protein [Planctomycetota bacterium]
MTAPKTPEPDASESSAVTKKRKRSLLRFGAVACLALTAVAGYFFWHLPRQKVRLASRDIQSLRFQAAARQLQDYPSWGLELGRVHFLLARMSRHQSGYVAALEHLRIARAARYDDQALTRERALLQIQNGQPASSQADRLDTFCSQAPEDRSEIYTVFINGYLRERNTAEAIKLLDRWAKELPQDGRADYTRGIMLQRAGKESEALNYYREATKKSPRLIDGYLAQARTHAAHWRYEQAVTAYRRALKVDPDRLSIQIALGKALWILRKGDEAVAVLEPITKSDPTVFPAGQICARHYLQVGDPQRAIDILEPVMQTHGDDASLNYMLGSAYHQLGKEDRSDAAMQKFFAANKVIDELTAPIEVPQSQYFTELVRRGMLNTQYDWEQSIKWLNMAARTQPKNPLAHELLALRYRENGTPEQALRKENIALSLRSTPPR